MSLLKDKRFWLFVTFGVIILVVSLRRQDSKKSELPILGKLIDFQLTDQNGEIFSKEDLLGKVWVADFIFTTCAGPCPVMSGQFAELQSRFSNAPDLNLLSISVNPDYDSPEILREYGGRYGANYNKWRFLTGDREAIHELAVDGFKVGSVEDPIFHSTRFILLDDKARIRGYYISSELEEMQQLWRDVELLAVVTP
ncbi:MAG TPA: SCO family protein [Candidatus Marinimicrobia bacterium]|jgi:protein SCO1/2|nr:SCO family protein [Candidatus Neomarinimicrobiota bacterium]HHZ99490.1 SCO family protein [Candidatus Neomarinimicrobiota bacterium]HIB03096.1 SCO family protein [Candidatus Neomarinimicrobiota bacterium]HIB70766.1 SCO family protein [Candidatus Neomarinimicrobiota bacterium]HIB96801.1 SCO family protein [Candidatus Neomarinimicrobiota bacterium]